ncbi:MAG: hypothetical protein HY241_00800 [Actinobacteria bacterium]|nr:hypothetical protein [Actinomycetota bacterium]
MPVPPAVRRWSVPGLVVVAVAAIAVAAVLIGRGRGVSQAAGPPVLRLVELDAATVERDSDSAPDVPAGPQRIDGGPPVTVVGALPNSPDHAPIHPLPGGAVPRPAVAALATALGITGQPEHSQRGWHVVDANRRLIVFDAPGWPWTVMPAAAVEGPRGCALTSPTGRLCPPEGGVTVVPMPPGNPELPQGGPGAVPPPADGVTGGPGVVSTAAAAATATPRPGSGRPVPIPLPAPSALPVPDRPTDAEALAVANRLLAAVEQSGARSRVERIPGSVMVISDPVVAGLPTLGYATTMTVGAGSRIESGHGWLGKPTVGADYPLITAAEALRRLPVPLAGAECPQGCPGTPTEITGAALGLTLRWDADDRALLVPAWLYDVRGSQPPLVAVAIDPRYLGGAPSRPMGPVNPPVRGEPGQSSGSDSNGGSASGFPGVPGPVRTTP